MSTAQEIILLFILPMPVASIAWTVTHEEIFRELRDWCGNRSTSCRSLYLRKFFYLFTCEYCFSHYVVLALLFMTRYRLLYDDWRGYVIAGFSLVWISNFYLSFYGRVRLGIRRERVEIAAQQNEVNAPPEPRSHPPVVRRKIG